MRASIVVAGELLRAELLSRHQLSMLSIELDWILWNIGEQDLVTLPPHHRTRTIYY